VDPVRKLLGLDPGAREPRAHALERRAIIDGQLAGTGSRLADGSHVRLIGKDHVVIEDVLGQPMTLRMPPPFATAGQGLR
jgi:hypothetical protein